MNKRVLIAFVFIALLGQTWARPSWAAVHAATPGTVLCEEPTRPTGG